MVVVHQHSSTQFLSMAEASVGLENTTYTVMENELKLNVCVVVCAPLIDCPIVFPFELLFVATPATACMLLN